MNKFINNYLAIKKNKDMITYYKNYYNTLISLNIKE